jgi:cytochrome c-type biogenesis protein CcmH/NrfF
MMMTGNGWWNLNLGPILLLCVAVLFWIGFRRGRRRINEQTDVVLKKQEEGQALLRQLVNLQKEANRLLQALVDAQKKE